MAIPTDPTRSLDDDPHAAADQAHCALRVGELSVDQLIERTGLSGPASSQHLARLRADGVEVIRRRLATERPSWL